MARFLLPLFKALEIGVLIQDFERRLIDNSSAAAADVQIFLAFDGLHFIAVFVTRKETVRIRAVATQANPGFHIPLFALDVFFGTDHPLIVGQWNMLARPKS